jgi:hypothetical protein
VSQDAFNRYVKAPLCPNQRLWSKKRPRRRNHSSLGGEGVHAMSFTSPEILPEPNKGGKSMMLAEIAGNGRKVIA